MTFRLRAFPGRAGLLALALLIAAAAWAQVGFEPIRVDDSTRQGNYYPRLYAFTDTALLCTWAGNLDTVWGVYGQVTDLSGSRIGGREIYEEGSPPAVNCPPELQIARLAGGGEVRLLFHA